MHPSFFKGFSKRKTTQGRSRQHTATTTLGVWAASLQGGTAAGITVVSVTRTVTGRERTILLLLGAQTTAAPIFRLANQRGPGLERLQALGAANRMQNC